MDISLTLEFFRILEGQELEGLVCGECQEFFDTGQNSTGYRPKKDYANILFQDEVYHPECLQNYVFPVINFPV